MHAAIKEGACRNHTSQAERRPKTTSTLPRISSLPRDAHLLPLQQQQPQKKGRYNRMERTHSTPHDWCENDGTNEARPIPPTRNVYSYPIGLSSLGENDHPPPPTSQVTIAWQQTTKQSPSKFKSKFHRVFSGLMMRAPPSSSTDSQDYDSEEIVASDSGKRKVSPAGTGDNHHLPSLYMYSNAEHGSPQKRLSNR